jgi:hypothetical protein
MRIKIMLSYTFFFSAASLSNYKVAYAHTRLNHNFI